MCKRKRKKRKNLLVKERKWEIFREEWNEVRKMKKMCKEK
jgi:hypothetical protein